ncbi:MAG: hypothetical protein EXR93_09670 [Gemmatimonadetes bacterium]|nr:hypothetical protein [Gemmatimonadota bacterium]
MIRNSRRAALLACVAFALATSGFTLANGGEFFQPAGSGKVDLVYFGFIKDTNGKLITETAILRVFVDNLEMHFPFMPDKPGHYRSPDIGAYHKEMGVDVDPSAIRIDIVMPGWKQVRPISGKVPNKTKGTINIDFLMEKV